MANDQKLPGNRGQGDSIDQRLRAAFSRDAQGIADDGFSTTVLQRIRHRRNMRSWVLGGATLLGIAFVIRPLVDGLNALVVLTGQYQYIIGSQGVGWMSNKLVVGTGLAMLLIPVLTYLLDD